MASAVNKKRKFGSASIPKRTKKHKFQKQYHSSSESDAEGEEAATDAPRVRKPETTLGPQLDDNGKPGPQLKETAPKSILRKSADTEMASDEDEDDEQDLDSQASEDDSDNHTDSDMDSQDMDTEGASKRKTIKRRDPSVFASSMAAILSSKLPTSKRADPVLARSRQPETANKEMEDSKLEAKAKRKLRDEKRQAKEKGRVKDVLTGDADQLEGALDDQAQGNMTAAELAEQEKRLRKTAQRGVIQLFNAVRAAQVKGEEAARSLRESGLVGTQKREEKAGEMSRQSFLDMISSGKAKA